MDMKRNLFVAIIMLLFLVCGFLGKGEAGEYIGKYCWQMDDGGDIIELAITHMGDQHYIVKGKMTPSGIGGYVEPIIGNGEIIGNIFRAQITSIGHVSPEVFGFFGVVEINLTTFNGTVNGVGFGCLDGEKDCVLENQGEDTLTNIPCP